MAMSGGLSGKAKLFLSYARRDAQCLADRLVGDLERHGYDVWKDTRNIRAGRQWEREIEDGLRSTQIVVALLSPRAVRLSGNLSSPEDVDSVCLDEISFARFASPPKPIVPVMGVPCEPPFCIFRLDYVDMCSWSDSEYQYQAGLTRLLDAIDAALRGTVRYRWWESKLSPLDFAAFLHEKRQDFCGREWLFREIEAWRRSCTERALLITGDPGIGKSALVAQLVHLNPGGQVLAYHCCQADSRATLDPCLLVRSLAAMIASKINDYADMLSEPIVDEALSESCCARDPGGSLEIGILAPLERVHAPECGVRYILVDALDESLLFSGQKTTIVDMIASRLERLPHWLRFVATTRKDRAVLDSLRGLRARSLDAQDPRNLEDLDQYIRARCESPALRQRLAACHQSPELVCRILHDKSQGNFLYAQQTLQGIERDLYDVGRLDALPPGLAGLYQMFFARQYPDETAYVPIRRVLEVVLAAEEPPTCEMLAKATGLEGETELPAVLRRLSPYLPQCQTEGGERGYTLYHRSLANWLTNVDERGSLYYVSRARGHKALADACWADLQADSPNVSAYARAHLPAHLLALGDWERLLQVLATFREPSLMEEWVERGDELGAACLTNLINKGGLRSHHQAALAAQLARIHGNRGKYSDAEHWLRFALAHTSWWHGRRTRAVATHELGSLYLYRGDVTRAARCYRRALRLCMLGVPIYHDEVAANEVALATVALANVVLPGFRWSKVVRLARHAHREACSASNVPHALAAQRLLAIAFEHLGKYDASRAVCLSALEASHQAGADIERARLSSQAGYFFYRQAALHGQTYTQAREYSNQAVRIAEQIHHLYTMLDATLCLGGCALAEGQTEEAIKCFERVSSSLPPGRHRELLTAARLGLAAAAHQKGDTENARKGYQQAIALATEARGLPGLRMRSLIGLGAICWHDGDHREAEVFWQQARRCARRYSLLQQQMFNMNLRRCRMARNVPPL